VSFAAIALCVASQRIYVVCFVIYSVRKLLDTPSYRTVIGNLSSGDLHENSVTPFGPKEYFLHITVFQSSRVMPSGLFQFRSNFETINNNSDILQDSFEKCWTHYISYT
jgi:hypothetical protein